MLRRRDMKDEHNQTQEPAAAAPEQTPAAPTAGADASGAAQIPWRPMRQTGEEWRTQRPGGQTGDESVIGPDDFFNGNYKSERGVRVQGRVEGSIESKGHILIEQQAQVMADMTAEDITVAGRYNGKVECRRRFEITPTGIVTGEINTDLLVVQEGGYFDGKLKMRDRSGQPRTGSNARGERSGRDGAAQQSQEEQKPAQV